MAEVYEILEKALGVLQERGWRQGGYVGLDGSVCIAGACNLARGVDVADDGTTGFGETVCSAVTAAVNERGKDWIADWNDTTGRTQAEVEDLLREVIRSEKAKAGIPVSLPACDDNTGNESRKVVAA